MVQQNSDCLMAMSWQGWSPAVYVHAHSCSHLWKDTLGFSARTCTSLSYICGGKGCSLSCCCSVSVHWTDAETLDFTVYWPSVWGRSSLPGTIHLFHCCYTPDLCCRRPRFLWRTMRQTSESRLRLWSFSWHSCSHSCQQVSSFPFLSRRIYSDLVLLPGDYLWIGDCLSWLWFCSERWSCGQKRESLHSHCPLQCRVHGSTMRDHISHQQACCRASCLYLERSWLWNWNYYWTLLFISDAFAEWDMGGPWANLVGLWTWSGLRSWKPLVLCLWQETYPG